MHRIDTPTAQVDKFGQGKNGFTNGDPATGRRATDLNSDMWDAVQEEICTAIESAGLTLDKTKHDQLYQAIVKIITSKIPDALLRNNNLSDVVDKALARANLELGDSAVCNIGTTAKTVAAGNDSRIVGAMQKNQNGADIPDTAKFIENIGLKETLNPTKRVSIGALGVGLFDGTKPAINIGDSDSGFIFESDGVIGIYANNQKIAELKNSGIKSVGNMTILSGALILDTDTYFLRHTTEDSAGFSGNNIELGS